MSQNSRNNLKKNADIAASVVPLPPFCDKYDIDIQGYRGECAALDPRLDCSYWIRVGGRK
jgi:hypothetical protein